MGRPTYGTARAGSSNHLGLHFSTEPRQSLDFARYGFGLRGAEAARVAGDLVLSNRVYFYVDTGGCVLPEPSVGTLPHTVQLDGLDEAAADPLGIIARLRATDRSCRP